MHRSRSTPFRITLLTTLLTTLFATLSLTLVAVMGCARPARVVVRAPQAQVVTAAHNHKHTARCGHYRKGNTWYLVKGHVHGRHCGHVKVHSVWVLN